MKLRRIRAGMFEALRDALSGIRVLALTTNIPGPLAAARLRMLGAEVVKVEPLHGDPLRVAAPRWYAQLASSLEVLQLDLRSDAGRRTLHIELERSDVVLTAMRATSLERLGIVWEKLSQRHPRLSLVSITGESPPNDDRAGHDLTYQARAGTIAPPAMPRTLVGDMAAAERTVAATLAALFARERNGRGSYVNVSIVDCASSFAQPYVHGLTREGGSLGGGLPTYRLYPAEEGWVALAALEPHFIERLSAMLGTDSLDADTLTKTFRHRSAREWERMAEQFDVPLAAVR